MKTVYSFLLYSASLLGQKVTVPTNPYGGQCVSYVDHLTRWATDNRYNLAYTNAIDLLAKARANGIQVLYNDGKNVPQPGDIWVTRTYSHPYGHTGVFESVGGQPVTLEQNIDGNADALYNGGWCAERTACSMPAVGWIIIRRLRPRHSSAGLDCHLKVTQQPLLMPQQIKKIERGNLQ